MMLQSNFSYPYEVFDRFDTICILKENEFLYLGEDENESEW
jgi:hypothetical protein